ncbi:MAG TPA: prepilin-type N-terminal cleavage/methylation domain-containing protein [Noviherbaspirillum sp.]|uniref:prepilin-type N-terminal cleavage/methylation domain-containing protein n=1 Tax=Noviherbaspirillum sp. TaxID=1926288 RepID=UPI002DDC97AB|nr:prepilin-type N-terminal cleavage/methylation domain-containing protein [Noviherbaspirillum sp.]HEV2611820.1 prepilin-type N-terminal cleavage/methylation domain-containing protein [Noviherbaspirillum sp.]
MKQMQRSQSGFTLVEIAIVLVIIGLLLGGVLKGQEMIENSRIKSVVNDMNGVSAAYNSYFDRYRAIPGDEVAATLTARGWAGGSFGNGNGALGITPAQAFTNGGEQPALWRSLRASGMTAGDPTATGVAGLPRAGTGGLIAVTVGAYGMVGPAVCVSGLSTKQAAGIDTTVDGALPASNIGNSAGSLRGSTGAANPLAPTTTVPADAAYNETATLTPWTVCRPI